MGTHLSQDVSNGMQIHLQGRANESFIEKWSGRTNASVVTTYLRALDDGRILVEISGGGCTEQAAVESNFAVR